MADEEIPTPDTDLETDSGAAPDVPETAVALAEPVNIGREVITMNIEDEMRQSYLNYAMSTIIARALPDVRDGLKPVQRRILMAMSDLNLTPGAQHRKSAKIAGDTSGNYHPHGEAVVYPTMVRMAQDFSLRYPLVDGQGNFGCFTGDTKIPLLDGTEKSFAELAELPPDEIFHVYSVDAQGRIVVGEGRHSRITRRAAELLEVTLDNGEFIRCTPDHRFLLRDGTYKQAQDLTTTDSLMPGYFDTTPVKEGLNEYLRVQQPATGEYEFVHCLADQFNAERGLARPVSGAFVRHHKNFSRYDNRPTNIERMAFLEHLHVHAEHLQELWSDEAFRAAQRDGVQRFYDEHPEVREDRRERMTRQNMDAGFRKANGTRTSAGLKRRFEQDPTLAAAISARMTALWQDSDYRAKMSAALSGIEKRPLSATEKERVAQIISEKSRAMWGDEGKRAEIVDAISRAMASEEVRAKVSAGVKRAWQNPEYRAKYGEDHFSLMAQTLWQNPETRQKHSEKIGRQWETTTFAEAQRQGVQRSHARRLADNPQMMAELAAKAGAALTQRWADPAHRQQVMRQRIAKYGSLLIAQVGRENVTPAAYEANRNANWIPRLETALKYFSTFDEFVSASQTYNHKIVSLRWLEECADVYDITVDVHHNFLLASGVFVHNSIDGDPPAAMRYTEARMSAFATEMLQDLDRDTVNWTDNYDQTRQEPTVLPGKFPNLLCNGGSGIAVGMATNIPPHNLREIADGAMCLLDNPEATLDEIMEHVKGPDFPTAAMILGTKGIRLAYETGRGSVVMQARTTIEPIEAGRNQIIVTELPYQVIKARLIEQIADLVKQKKIEGIADLNDYTDRHGMRVVITLKREAYPKKVLNFLLKHTPLRTTFGVNTLALVNGQPRILTLIEALHHFLVHRREVIERRTLFELNKAKARAHILEGLQIALDFLDEIIALIRASRTAEAARTEMMSRYTLSQLQADAILAMQLRALTGLEREKLESDYKELLKQIAFYEDILSSPARVSQIIKQELRALKDKYGDERRTRIVPMEAEQIGDDDLIPEEEMIVSITRDGYIKRVPKDTYPTQHRGGKGRIGATTKEEDTIEHLFLATTHHFILFFTDRGRVYRLKAYEVPQTSRQAMGTAIINLINIQPGERITATVPMKEYKTAEGYLLLVTECGEVKRTKLAEFANLRNNGLIVFDIEPDDALRWVAHTSGQDEVILVTRKGMSIRFPEGAVPSRGRAAGGVRGIRLSEEKGDRIVGMGVVQADKDLLVISEKGISKRTPFSEYRITNRGGVGIKTMALSDKTGDVIDAKVVDKDDRLLIMTQNGITIRLRVDDIRSSGRSTQGVRAINLHDDDWVASVERITADQAPADVAEVVQPA